MESAQGGYGNSAGNFHIDSKVGTSGRIYLNWFAGTGGMSVGNGASGHGVARASAFTVSSDRRLKENISYFDNGLAQILQLKPATFDFINGENNQKGFIAQDVETVIPEVIGTTTMPSSSGEVDETDEYLTINSQAIIPYLVSAIKEQQTPHIQIVLTKPKHARESAGQERTRRCSRRLCFPSWQSHARSGRCRQASAG